MGNKSIASRISGLDNFNGVQVGGQTTYTYPSLYTNVRQSTLARAFNTPGGYSVLRTYMVGGNPNQGKSSLFGTPPKANQMQFYINGQYLRTGYQQGLQKK